MDFWGRWNQCKSCYYECGFENALGLSEDDELIEEHCYECKLGENCDSDFKCDKFSEDE